MAEAKTSYYQLNRGLVSRLALARMDIKRTAMSAQVMTNYMPRVLGSMMLRPGLGYLGSMSSRPKILPFVFSTDDTALVEITSSGLRIWVGDTLVSRPSVTSAVTNGDFAASLAGWTASAGATWVAPGYAQFVADGTVQQTLDQTVVVAGANVGVLHALRIVIARGPVKIRVGTAAGDENYVSEATLETGTHSLAFTPTGNFTIRFFSTLIRKVWVDSCNVEAAGVLQLPNPWLQSDFYSIRYDQSGDVLFVACAGNNGTNYQQRRIERRANSSWSIVLYQSNSGPFRPENVGPITITPSALNGNITLTASAALFTADQVGALFRVRSAGQRVSSSISAANTFTNTILVAGVGEARRFTWTGSGVWVGTVTLQRSVGVIGFWEDVNSETAPFTDTNNDGLDNQVVYYRVGFKAGDYTSGTAVLTITYTLGSITGVARITDYTSSAVVGAEVLQDFGGTDASDLWAEGSWSDRRGWPTAVAFYEGRLWWSGKNGIFGSVSDAFDDFDPATEGDSGPINRTIGSGPVDDINWLLPLQRLIIGAEGTEFSARSTAFDEPLTPANFNIKGATTQGSGNVMPVKVDSRGVFVQRSLARVYELAYSGESNDYAVTDLTALVPDLGSEGIVTLAVQRQPDTRIHGIRADGTAMVGIIDRVENVLAWIEVETDGLIEDVVVLPGTGAVGAEDQVYYAVERTTGATGVSALTVTPGSGYTTRPTLEFDGGGGVNAAGTVDLILVSAVPTAAGAGYVVGNVLTLVGGTVVTAASVRVETVDGGGGVTSVSVAAVGDYTVRPANPAATTGGAGAGCTITATWGLGIGTVTSTGGGYTTAPTVTIIGGGGVGGAVAATVSTTALTGHYLEKWALESDCIGGTQNKQADAFITYSGSQVVTVAGYVSSLSVVPGTGYATPPVLSFSGGGGSGAAGTVTLTYLPTGGLFTAGSGYSVGDVLTFVGGTFTRAARIQVLAVFGSGQILSVDVFDGGSYSVRPGFFAATTGGTGSGASFAGIWGLGEATITNPGTGYTSPPTVTVVGGGGTLGSVQAAITTGTTVVPGSAATITGLNHLEGKEVVVWADGVDLSPDDDDGVQTTYTVSQGAIALDRNVSEAIVGLPYSAQWKSTKLAQATDQGSWLNQRKSVSQLGLIMADVHSQGVKYGPDFDTLDPLPKVEQGAVVDYDTVWPEFDFDMMAFAGGWNTDSRICLESKAPRPCTVLAITIAIEEHSKG